MTEHTFLIGLGQLHCADCLTTLADVVLPKTPGVLGTAVEDGALRVTVDEDVLTETQLVETLTEAGLLR